MIAITGPLGVGKTHTINMLREKGYSILIADDFFKNQYKYNNQGYRIIKRYLGNNYIDEKGVNINKLRSFAIQNMNSLEKMVHPLLQEELKENYYDFVEIPILNSKHADFRQFFSIIINITNSKRNILNELKSRKIDKQFLDVVNKRAQIPFDKKAINITSGDIQKILKLL